MLCLVFRSANLLSVETASVAWLVAPKGSKKQYQVCFPPMQQLFLYMSNFTRLGRSQNAHIEQYKYLVRDADIVRSKKNEKDVQQK